MHERNDARRGATNDTTVERTSDRELMVTRTFDAPARVVFDAWTRPELFQRWWVPKSAPFSLLSCEMDVRTGGTYRLVFRDPAGAQPVAFFGSYREVTPPTRLVWTNDESDQGAVTTVTFEEKAGNTRVTLHELYPSTEALDEALAGSTQGLPEQFAQLDALLAGQP
jgi:uncharacterized protein YndB with AHSA1/START domain